MGILGLLGLRRMRRRRETARPTARTLVSWPDDIANDASLITFGISLKPKIASPDWERTCHLLSKTLGSVLNQTHTGYRILICGHDLPPLPESKKIEFLAAQHKPTLNPKQFITDMHKKRYLMGQRLRQLGGGLFMQLDGDDLLHRDVVATRHQKGLANGVVFTTGYVYDLSNDIIAPVPGAWSIDIDRVCGSTAICRFSPEDIPASWQERMTHRYKFDRAAHHAYIRALYDEDETPLTPVDAPLVVYVVNTQENMSFATGRAGSRSSGLLNNIRKHAISDETALADIAEMFHATMGHRSPTRSA